MSMNEQWVNKLMENLKRLRELQKKYFATRNRDILVRSKTYEAEVDQMIDQYFSGKNSLFSSKTDKVKDTFKEDW